MPRVLLFPPLLVSVHISLTSSNSLMWFFLNERVRYFVHKKQYNNNQSQPII
jgi:hypothetical protein